MSFIVFHVFSGLEESLAKKTGGVEAFLNNMLRNNVDSEIYSMVIGRKHKLIPRIITEFKSYGTAENRNQRTQFPYLAYLLSNLILGIALSFLLLLYNGRQSGIQQQRVIQVHDPVIAASLFLFFPRFLKSEMLVSQFHSEYRRRLEIMLPNTLMSKLTVKLYSYSEKICIWQSDFIVAVSKQIRNYLIAAGCSSRKISVVPIFLEANPNLISSSATQIVNSLGIHKNQVIITYVGRLSKEKNLHFLLSGFLSIDPSIRNNLTLLIVGTGNQLNDLRRMVPQEETNRVRFLGHRSDVDSILDITDIFVLPSLSEGFPFSLLEAMNHGKAIVTSNIPTISEVVKNGHDALLIDPKSSEQLIAAITAIYSDPNLGHQLGINAKEKARQYSKDKVVPKLINAYASHRRK